MIGVVLLGGIHFASSYPGRYFRFDRFALQTPSISMVGISSISQDNQGFLWLGTSAGLFRYDGYRFLAFPIPAENAAPSSPPAVFPVVAAGSGGLWVGTNGRGLAAFSAETNAFIQAPAAGDDLFPALPGEIVLSVQEDAAGHIWVGTRTHGLFRIDNKTRIASPYPLDSESECIWDILADRSGRIWVGTHGDGLFRIDPGAGTTVSFRFLPDDSRSLGGDIVRSLFEDHSGTIWAGTKNGGLNRFEPEMGGFVRVYGGGDFPRDLASHTVTSISEDSQGRIWLGTDGDGLRIWDRERDAYLCCRHDPQNPYSLSDNDITSIFKDAGGILWIGTVRGGLNKCTTGRAKFEHYRHNPSNPKSLAEHDVQALWLDDRGGLWVGTKTGLEQVDSKKGAVSRYEGSVLALAEDADGRIWFGTDGEGLVSLDPDSGRLKNFRRNSGTSGNLSHNRVTVLCPDRRDPGFLWVGTQRGLNRFETRSGRTLPILPEPRDTGTLARSVVTALLDDKAGFLWIGTARDLYRLEKVSGRFEIFSLLTDAPPQASGPINCLAEGMDGTIWVGTQVGLVRFDPVSGSRRIFAQKDGLKGEVVCGILEDTDGGLWVSTNRGLSRYDMAAGTFHSFGLHDGLQDRTFALRAAARGTDGRMAFGGPNGINVFDPAGIEPDPFIPPVFWTAFYRNNVEIEPPAAPNHSSDFTINYKMGLITFEFAALSFAAPELNSFAYRLDPRDTAWTSLVPERSVSFFNLHPGSYTLRVKAANPDGLWNEPGIALDFIVIRPFWTTWWFILGAGAAAGAGGIFLASRRRKSARRPTFPEEKQLAGVFETYGLTAREKEILGLVLSGESNKEIGRKLFISPSTARNHISNIYQKIGVRNRLELINRIARNPVNLDHARVERAVDAKREG